MSGFFVGAFQLTLTYHMVETCFNGIMNRIVHDDMTSIIHRLQLFYSCSKSAADSGRMISNVVFIISLLCSCRFYRTYLDTLAIDSHRDHIFLSTFHARYINHPNSVPIVFVTTSSNCKNPV